MSKLHTILLLVAASVLLSGCLVIETEHSHHTDTVQTYRPAADTTP